MGPEDSEEEVELETCRYHGEYRADSFFCPGCEEEDARAEESALAQHAEG